MNIKELRADRDAEKRLRKDAEHALSDASELLTSLMLGAEKWLRAHDPIRLNRDGAAGETKKTQ